MAQNLCQINQLNSLNSTMITRVYMGHKKMNSNIKET